MRYSLGDCALVMHSVCLLLFHRHFYIAILYCYFILHFFIIMSTFVVKKTTTEYSLQEMTKYLVKSVRRVNDTWRINCKRLRNSIRPHELIYPLCINHIRVKMNLAQ